MRVHVVDPSAYTPPYDHALCSALATAGADVELFTSRFAYGPQLKPAGYARHEHFYRLATHVSDARIRRAMKLAEHVPDMLRYRRAARSADVVHFQWLAVQQLDGVLLPRWRPLVLTAHDILPREGRFGQRGAQRRLYARFDAIVVHSEHGRRRLTHELGVDPGRVHVIPHGAFSHLATRSPRDGVAQPASYSRDALSAETTKPVVLFFGLMRPYKGVDLLLEAWRGIEDAELWIVGMPRMDMAPLVESAPPGVHFVLRFVDDDELASYFERADLVVLPYREIDQSGVLFTALAFGKPLLLSNVGAFPEIAATGAARTFPAGDAGALARELRRMLAEPAALAEMGRQAREVAAERYSWDTIGRQTFALYESLLSDPSLVKPIRSAPDFDLLDLRRGGGRGRDVEL